MHATPGHAQAESAHLEMGFLLACLRHRYDPASPIPDCAGINWNRCIELALRHRVGPMVYRQIVETGVPVPEEARERLKDIYASNAARNMARLEEMRRLVGLFRDKSVPAMVLRGPVLAASVYGDLSLRQFSDLDLLVRSEDVPRISGILSSEGYRPQFDLDPLQEKALIRFRTERCFIRSADHAVVDLHWRLLPAFFSFEAEMEPLWERSVSLDVDGTSVRTLGKEDLFLFLCMHGAKHGWDQLALVCDLGEMIRAGGKLNWSAIVERAERSGKRRMLAVGAKLVLELLGISTPAVDGDRVADQLVEVLEGRLAEGLGVQEGGGWIKWRIAWRLMESARDRLAYALDLTVVPTGMECEMVRLPKRLFGLYRLLRMGRLMGKAVSGR